MTFYPPVFIKKCLSYLEDTVKNRFPQRLSPESKNFAGWFAEKGLAPTGSLSHTPRYMALHPQFPTAPYATLVPEQRWFPADEALRSTSYEKLLPPLVAKVREEVFAWRNGDYAGASPTSALVTSFTDYKS